MRDLITDSTRALVASLAGLHTTAPTVPESLDDAGDARAPVPSSPAHPSAVNWTLFQLEDNHVAELSPEQEAVQQLIRPLYDAYFSDDEEAERADEDVDESEVAEPQVSGMFLRSVYFFSLLNPKLYGSL